MQSRGSRPRLPRSRSLRLRSECAQPRHLAHSADRAWAVPGIAVVILGVALVSAEMASRPRSPKFWAGASRTKRVAAAALVAVLVALMSAGGGPTDDRPYVRAGRYVATQHGDVIRVLSPSAYDDLRMQVLRMALLAVGGLAALLWLGWITKRQPAPS